MLLLHVVVVMLLLQGTVGAQVDCPKHVLGSNRNSAVKKGCVHGACCDL